MGDGRWDGRWKWLVGGGRGGGGGESFLNFGGGNVAWPNINEGKFFLYIWAWEVGGGVFSFSRGKWET